jgi:hypothetical protein
MKHQELSLKVKFFLNLVRHDYIFIQLDISKRNFDRLWERVGSMKYNYYS